MGEDGASYSHLTGFAAAVAVAASAGLHFWPFKHVTAASPSPQVHGGFDVSPLHLSGASHFAGCAANFAVAAVAAVHFSSFKHVTSVPLRSLPQVHGYAPDSCLPLVIVQVFARHLFESLSHFWLPVHVFVPHVHGNAVAVSEPFSGEQVSVTHFSAFSFDL